MPPDGDCLVMQDGERKIIWSCGDGWFDQGRTAGLAQDMGITHWSQLLPSPPLSVETPNEVQK